MMLALASSLSLSLRVLLLLFRQLVLCTRHAARPSSLEFIFIVLRNFQLLQLYQYMNIDAHSPGHLARIL